MPLGVGYHKHELCCKQIYFQINSTGNVVLRTLDNSLRMKGELFKEVAGCKNKLFII